jgi:predicted CXXCH cytochrome family protein
VAPRFRDYEHLLRLATLFVAGTLVFFVLQAVLVPKDFGELGHYRTSAVTDNRERPLNYAGEVVCRDCHEEVRTVRSEGGHAGVRCESCHGPHALHASGEGLGRRPEPGFCTRCHAARAARPRGFPQVDPAAHSGGEACTTCHQAHAPGLR